MPSQACVDECVSLGALTCAGVNWKIRNSRCFLKNPGYGDMYEKLGVNCVEISCLENNRKGQLKKYPTLYRFLKLSNKFIVIVIPESTLTRSIKLIRKLREFLKIL